ncbi:MAG: glutamate formimidoyltransferase [Desulfobulbaceae bacterium]|nr:MAG: glutamate formimidoyltransferase [Desulfobulbaceae bacterium]
MERIVECVPNFSEGRDRAVIDRITAQIEGVEGVRLLDVDSGRDTNRCVVTFAGEPEAVLEAAFQAIRCASELIDMRRHAGAHPRMGATDVCPLVPVAGVTMAECVELARRLGKRVAEELAIPVYLYEEAAATPERRSLAWLRSGEYEGLTAKLQRPDFRPDFGEAVFNARSGATVIGARQFLIAWNINLNTASVRLAQEIAIRLREKGGKVRNRATGETETVPGLLPAVRAVGWYIDEYGLVQVSINLLDFRITPLHRVFEETERLAADCGLRVTGSELVGLVPLAALVDCGRHFLNRQGGCRAVSETELVRVAAQSLGLSDVAAFEPQHKIIEYRLRRPAPLASLTLSRFADELASSSPAPGGGSVAALAGALSVSLSAMVGNLTFGKKGYGDVSTEIEALAVRAQELKRFFLEAVDRDTASFNRVMAAIRMPKKTGAEIERRQGEIEAANKEAARVPLDVLEKAVEAAELAREMTDKGNRNSLSDAGVAGLAAEMAGLGAIYNVLINLDQIDDPVFTTEMRRRAFMLRGLLETAAGGVKQMLFEQLAGPGEKCS